MRAVNDMEQKTGKNQKNVLLVTELVMSHERQEAYLELCNKQSSVMSVAEHDQKSMIHAKNVMANAE